MFRTLTAYGIEVVIVLAILNGIAWLVKNTTSTRLERVLRRVPPGMLIPGEVARESGMMSPANPI